MARTNVRGEQVADGANGIDLAVDVTGTLPVGNGGTGKTSATLGSLLVGNGTSPLGEIAPSSNGYVLQVVGGVWTATPISSGTQRTFAYWAG